MRGLVLLFIALISLGVAWQYTPQAQRKAFRQLIARHLGIVALAFLIVVGLVITSLNTTIKVI